ncbi:MAG: hypothetical protein JRH11_07670 [Deltaproteobacteria bacterium]|nr:hypothetical protein [Deltaproteobacteria bacterium]
MSPRDRKARASVLFLGGLAWGLLLSSCTDGPEDLRFKGYLVTVPAGFTTARDGYGPHQTLVLVSPENPIACRLVVVRDSRRFGETDARAFLATGRDRYGGADERPLSLQTSDGTLAGWSRAGIEVPAAWGIIPRAGTPTLEVYAAGRGTELVGMLIGWYDGDPRAPGPVEACRGALSTLRR